MSIRPALRSQFHATLAMLRDAVERCPDSSWDDPAFSNRFWHLAYHVLFYTDLYLHPGVQSFTAWEGHRKNLNFLGMAPTDPPTPVDPGEPLPKARIVEYWAVVDSRVDAALDTLDLDAPESGFPWYPVPKLEHVLVCLRHLAHHTGQLTERVREAGGDGVAWVPAA